MLAYIPYSESLAFIDKVLIKMLPHKQCHAFFPEKSTFSRNRFSRGFIETDLKVTKYGKYLSHQGKIYAMDLTRGAI